MEYIKPDANIIRFENSDIMTTSAVVGPGDDVCGTTQYDEEIKEFNCDGSIQQVDKKF